MTTHRKTFNIIQQSNRIYKSDALEILPHLNNGSIDLIICDGPYGVTDNDWDKVSSIQEFNLNLIKIFSQKLKPGGTLYLFGKPDCIDFIDYRPFLKLQSKIVWYQPSRLAQGRRNYTNNYDIICYFTKGDKPKAYNLDDIRIPQLVELEHRLRCERVPSVVNGQYGKTKFNEQGKNPGDVWGDIKQLTYKSKELVNRKALNTIQKPEKLMERLIRASSCEGDLVLDPFCGVGTVPAVCKRLGRDFIGIERNTEFVEIANKRVESVHDESETKFSVNFDAFDCKTRSRSTG
ncbi:MAG: site-specific DNA-methyltransferase [Planctomycetaceae bacterium]|nr:site-specific DNA-methyltransferase [Planctomycetaceae bacterium]